MKKLISTLVGLLLATITFADTGTVSFTYNQPSYNPKVITATYVEGTSATGAVGSTSIAINGEIARVTVVPGTTAAPSAAPNVYLRDDLGVDLLNGAGSACTSNAVFVIRPGFPIGVGGTNMIVSPVVHGIVSCVVSNAGDTRTGSLIILLK